MPIVSYVLQGGPTQADPYPVPTGVTSAGQLQYENYPDNRYATPRLGNGGYGIKAYSPTLGVADIGEIPDPERTGQFPIIDYRGDVRNLQEFYQNENADWATRNAQTREYSTGATESKGVDNSGLRYVPQNKVPPPEVRWTQQQNPNSYSLVRPFGNGMGGIPKSNARHLNGWHFSMADHKRNSNTEIFGMQPRRQWRNILSTMPAPWDEYIVDAPGPSQPMQAIVEQNGTTAFASNGAPSYML